MQPDANRLAAPTPLKPHQHTVFSVSNIKSHIPRSPELKNPNFRRWKQPFLITVGKFGLKEFLDGSRTPQGETDEVWTLLSFLVCGWIINTVSDGIFNLLETENATAHYRWTQIDEIFKDNKETRAMYLNLHA